MNDVPHNNATFGKKENSDDNYEDALTMNLVTLADSDIFKDFSSKNYVLDAAKRVKPQTHR